MPISYISKPFDFAYSFNSFLTSSEVFSPIYITLAFNEQFANYTALKLTNCQENLDNVRKVLGDEYTSFMDSLLTKSLTKLGVKQDMADIDSSRYTSNSKANNCL